jgi:hypothetical protein
MAAKKKAKKTAKAAPKAAKAAKVVAKIHKPGPIPATTRPRTKSDILAVLADQTGLSRKDVGNVFASLSTVIRPRHLHGPRPDEDHPRSQAGNQGSQRHQSFHGSGNRFQGEASTQRREGSSAERPQGNGQVRPFS